MNLETRIANIRAKVAAVSQIATRLYGVDMSGLVVRFDAKGTARGHAGYKDGIYYIRFNHPLIETHGYDGIITNTVPHEIAHIVCFKNPLIGRNHNRDWARVCIALGGDGRRCHQEDVVLGNGLTYEYITTTGKKFRVGQAKHRRVHARLKLGPITMRKAWVNGIITKDSPVSIVGQRGYKLDTPVVAKVGVQPVISHTSTFAAYVQPKVRQGGQSNAEKVRELIKLAKSFNRNQENVISAAQTNLGMSRGLATTYVKNNWNKV